MLPPCRASLLLQEDDAYCAGDGYANPAKVKVPTSLPTALDAFEADEDLWVGVVCSAHPKVFCAGADLKAVSAGTPISTLKGGFAGIVKYPRRKPMIAAVDGAALAGGCEIVLACDMCVAGDRARFGVPEVKRSLIPAAGGNFRLMQKLPRSIALELILTGDPIPAEKAYELGLVNRLVQPGEELETAIELAKTITVNAPLAVREALRVAREGVSMEDDDAFKLSNERMGYLSTTPDFREGPLAFTEKRAPKWTGKPGDPARL